ncbi:SixA phosphatase family protein [Luteibaculum oceani]|uniref:Histidine phosphatase family protein n=1 Tax=Luteibaculum oceani TaxID=1294296 RepID=A0A5C6USD0_9FLAO|nr:histidine phosphatase family protein [Luteibaculum oceani]TXC76233.1 histidine phosphatase family protein [Luteibaculum oceani]
MSLELFVIRHAKSSWAENQLKDYDRPLNNRGYKSIEIMGEHLKSQQIKPDIILYSTAKRTTETFEGLLPFVQSDQLKISPNRILYHASSQTIFSAISEIPTSCKKAFYIGHNPGVTDFVNELCGENISNIPTLGIAHIQLEIKSWNEIFLGTGTLKDFVYPKKFSPNL